MGRENACSQYPELGGGVLGGFTFTVVGADVGGAAGGTIVTGGEDTTGWITGVVVCVVTALAAVYITRTIPMMNTIAKTRRPISPVVWPVAEIQIPFPCPQRYRVPRSNARRMNEMTMTTTPA